MTPLTTQEAADQLGVSIRHIQRLIAQGKLPALKKGRDWLIMPKNLKAIAIRNKPGRPPKEKE